MSEEMKELSKLVEDKQLQDAAQVANAYAELVNIIIIQNIEALYTSAQDCLLALDEAVRGNQFNKQAMNIVWEYRNSLVEDLHE